MTTCYLCGSPATVFIRVAEENRAICDRCGMKLAIDLINALRPLLRLLESERLV